MFSWEFLVRMFEWTNLKSLSGNIDFGLDRHSQGGGALRTNLGLGQGRVLSHVGPCRIFVVFMLGLCCLPPA